MSRTAAKTLFVPSGYVIPMLPNEPSRPGARRSGRAGEIVAISPLKLLTTAISSTGMTVVFTAIDRTDSWDEHATRPTMAQASQRSRCPGITRKTDRYDPYSRSTLELLQPRRGVNSLLGGQAGHLARRGTPSPQTY